MMNVIIYINKTCDNVYICDYPMLKDIVIVLFYTGKLMTRPFVSVLRNTSQFAWYCIITHCYNGIMVF